MADIPPVTASGSRILVAIVTYNSADHIRDAIESVRRSRVDREVHIVVVDNASTDSTAEIAQAFDGVTVVQTGQNLGYSGGINVARTYLAPGDWLAVLNPDLTVSPDALARLVDALTHPGVGIVAPLLRRSTGAIDHHLRKEPSILGSLGDAFFGERWQTRPRWLTDVFSRDEDYASARDVAWAGGAALLVSAECNERVGAWNGERYFLYSEETDYARRARDLGFSVRFEPRAEVRHLGGGSGESPQLLALMAVNRVRYFESHNGTVRTAAFRAVVTLRHVLRAARPDHRLAAITLSHRKSWTRLPSLPAGSPVPSRAEPPLRRNTA